MSYEDAISTKLLATHCVFCGHPLRDPESVERGWGPECNEKYAMGRYMPEDHNPEGIREAMEMAPEPLKGRWEQIGGKANDPKARWNTSPEIRRQMLSVGLEHGALAASYGSGELKTINDRVASGLLVIAAVQRFALAAGYENTAEKIADKYTNRFTEADNKKVIRFIRDQQHVGVLGVHAPYNEQWSARCREARDIFFRSEKRDPLFFRFFHEKHLDRVINMLQGVFGGRMAIMEGRLITLPAVSLPEPVPVTPPTPPPRGATNELPKIPREIEGLKVGDKIKIPGGGTSIIQYVNPTKKSVGVGPEKGRNYTWFSFAEVEVENGQRVAEELYGKRKRANEKEGLGEAPDPVKLPKVLPVGLFAYQIESVDFVEKHRRVLVGDEMGLGKSVIGAVVIEAPGIVVCEAGLRINWVRELNKWRPDLRVALIEGSSTPSPLQRSADVVVINYDILHSHVEWLKLFGAATLVADEATALKNLDVRWNKASKQHEPTEASPRRAKAFYELHGGVPKLVFLSGTPILNRSREIFPLLHMMNPEEWSSGYSFCLQYCGGHEVSIGRGRRIFKCDGNTNSAELHDRLIRRYMVRHTKAEVLKELPPKGRRTQMVSLSDPYKGEYRKAANNFIAWVNENGGAARAMAAKRAEVLNRMTALRGISAKGKVEAGLAWIRQHVVDTGRPLVVMAHHKAVFGMISAGLDAMNDAFEADMAAGRSPELTRPIRHAQIVGGVSLGKGQQIIDDFQAGEVDVVLYSIEKAKGATLTRAQEMLFIERVWTPMKLVQAEDRIHRMTQKNAVVITYLDAEGTIDAKLAMMLVDKTIASVGVVDGIDLKRDQASAFVFGELFDVDVGTVADGGDDEEPDLEPNYREYAENPSLDDTIADSWNQPL